MGTTKDFNETVRADLQNSAEYRRAYLREAVGAVVSGDVETGKSVLRKYINGTLGFVALGEAVGRSSKTLMQMLGPRGTPQSPTSSRSSPTCKKSKAHPWPSSTPPNSAPTSPAQANQNAPQRGQP